MSISIQIYSTGNKYTFIARDNATGEDFKDSDYFTGAIYESRNEAASAGADFAKRKLAEVKN